MKHVEKMMKQMMAVEEVKQQGLGGNSTGYATRAPLDNDVAMEVIELMLVQKGLSFQIAEWNEWADANQTAADKPSEGFNVKAAVAACKGVWAKLRTYKAKHTSSYNYVYKEIFGAYDADWWFTDSPHTSSLGQQISFLEKMYRELAAEEEEAESKSYAAKPVDEPKKGCMTVVKAEAKDSSHRVSPDHPDALTNLISSDGDYEAERTSDVYAEFGAVQEHATMGARSREWWSTEG